MGKANKKAISYKINGVELPTKKALLDYLKEHALLQHCTEESLENGTGVGRLIWARNPGSVYWPALIASLEDKDDQISDQEDENLDDPSLWPNAYRSVVFLETSFRYTLLAWKDIILVNDEKFDEQYGLIRSLNKHVIKKNWKDEKAYKDAVSLLKEFGSINIEHRQAHAYQLSIQRKKEKFGDRPVKPKKSNTPALTNGSQSEKKARTSDIYGLRPDNSKSPESAEQNETETASVTGAETLSDISMKAKQPRPKTGGPQMKEYVHERFLCTQTSFKFSASTTMKCASCLEVIETGELTMCHDYPYHSYCLILDSTQLKDGTIRNVRKCKCCWDQACFICKSKTTATEMMATKCSKCDLKFHRSCLLIWPQAIVQGSIGPITCPAHFCHTCVGEHYVLRKVRNCRAFAGNRYRCLLCPSAYHKPYCIPAGCGENITSRDFIICPRHTLADLKVTQRRFGCLTCGKNLKTTNTRRIECSLCLQVFHPECVGYSNDHIDEGVSVQAFGDGYKCSSCFWGLFPLYGQVIWYQQVKNPFWPARILYPTESTGRYAFIKNRLPGQYSVKYFGPLPSYFDKCSRTFPLSLATVKLFTTVKVYQEENNQIKSAYDEAGFFSLLVDDHRDRLLTTPAPYYKKIERNIYRYSTASNKKGAQEEDTQLECYCAEGDGEVCCTPNSGCHNRDTAVECNDNNCKGGVKCQNRMFTQKKKDTENTEQFLTQGKGWAVRAARDLKEGDFIVEYCGEIISNAEMQYRANRKTEEDPLYILEIDKHTFIDAEFCGNVSRLINHSCEPNSRIEKYTSDGKPVVGVFAYKDISKDEELTFDYAYGNKSSAPFRCHCGTSSCRGFIGKEASSSTPEAEPDILSAELEKYDKECAKCQFGGHVLCCDYEDCYKVYHKSCAGLTREPENEWFCPNHKIKPKAGKRKSSASVPSAKKKIALVPKRKSEGKKTANKKLPLPKTKEITAEGVDVVRVNAMNTINATLLFNPSKTNGELETSSNKDSGTAENTPSETSSEPSTIVSFVAGPTMSKTEAKTKTCEDQPNLKNIGVTPRSERLVARRRLSRIMPKDENKDNLGVVTEWLKKSEGTTLEDGAALLNVQKNAN